MVTNFRARSKAILGILVMAAFSLAISCRDDSGGQTPVDSGADPSVADGSDDTDTGEDAGDLPSEPDTREIVASAVARTCIGCDRVSWCGMPPRSDGTAVSFDAAPNNETGVLFAAERWESAGRLLPVDSCETFTGDELETIVTPPSGITVFDAGPIHLSGDMPLLTEPITNIYGVVTHNYSSSVRLVDSDSETDYAAGANLHIEAEGGAEVSAFSVDSPASETLEILTPHTDENGQIDNIPTDESIHVTWTGGSGFERVVVLLEVFYCPLGWTAMVICHVTNDGDFTIPSERLGGIEWANVAELHLTGSTKHAIEADGLEGEPAWSVRSTATVPVYHDPEAMPDVDDCSSAHMEEG